MIRLAFLVVLAGAIATPQGVITTVSGTTFHFPVSSTATTASLGHVESVVADAKGTIYATDPDNAVVVKIAPDGVLAVVAGNGVHGFSGDGGLAVNAALDQPGALAIDSQGALYIADRSAAIQSNRAGTRIRRVGTDGKISTVAGGGSPPFLTNVPIGCPANGVFAAGGPVGTVTGMAVSASGTLYFSDTTCYRVYQVTQVGTLSIVLQFGVVDWLGGSSNPANLSAASGLLALDPGGNIYVGLFGEVRKIAPGTNPASGITVAGQRGASGFGGDKGLATSASLRGIRSLQFEDATGSLYIADFNNNRVRRVDRAGNIDTVAGSGPETAFTFALLSGLTTFQGSFAGDGSPATAAKLRGPTGVAIGPSGTLFIADSYNYRIRRVEPSGIISTFAGNGQYGSSGDGGDAKSATFYYPTALAVDPAGNLYVADTGAHIIRRISVSGTITTVAGTGEGGFSGDGGPAIAAKLNQPTGVAVDRAGNIYISELGNGRLRRVDPFGQISTLAQGTNAYSVAVDQAGTVYFGTGTQIFRVAPDGKLTVIAGNGTNGAGGSEVPATSVGFGPYIRGLTVDPSGSIAFIGFTTSIFKVTPDGIVHALGGGTGFAGDGGPVSLAKYSNPLGITSDTQGNIYVADSGNNRVRKIKPDGTISTIAGSGPTGFGAGTYFGDGALATEARLNVPWGLAFGPEGNLYIVDNLNQRVRAILAAQLKADVSPASLTFSATSGGAIPPVQSVSLRADVPGLDFYTQTDASWLTVSPAAGFMPRILEITADPTTLSAGTYTGHVFSTARNASPQVAGVTVTFTVAQAQAPKLIIDKQSLSFSFPRTSAARRQPVTLSNDGGGSISFTASARTTSGGNWLSVLPSTGSVLASAPVVLNVAADPAGLAPGTYRGVVTVNEQTVAVAMTISAGTQAIVLSQTGLSYLGVSQGGIVAPQSFGVVNIGTGVISWTVSTTTLSGGPDWLQVDTTRGSTDAASAVVPNVRVSVNASSLPAGKYYGLVQVDAPNASNSPQVVTVFLQVLPAGTNTGATAQPSELLFAASAGTASSGSQDLLLYNVSAAPKSFQASVTAPAGLRIVVLPSEGTLDPQQPFRVVVQPFTESLAAGVYTGTVTLQFSDGRVRALRLSVVVSAGPVKSNAAGREATGVCSPTSLLQALTTLGQSFSVSAGYPVALGVDVKDDCGIPLDAGSVSISFSNGDPTVALQSVKGGHWEGTWTTMSSSAAQIVMKLQATDESGKLRGERQIQGLAEAQADPPSFDKSGIFSAASAERFVPLAPGSIISIYGERLAPDSQAYSSVPLPLTLQTTNVIMAGRLLPLYYVSPGQINAQVPFDLNVNTTHQIYVRKGATASQPIPVDVAPAQPAIFALVPARSPAQAGDVLVIYASGLGAVDPAVPSGTPPGAAISNAINPVSLAIGGRAAQVLFAGLAPGFVGLYQVNALVPPGVAAGAAVPVTLTVAGQISPPASLPVQ